MNVKTANIQEKLKIIREHLSAGRPDIALQILETDSHHTELAHARGVCLLRLNKIDAALDIFREVVFGKFISMPASTPALYKANYMTALLLKGFTQMALEIETTLRADDHPYIGRLKQAIGEWKRTLPPHQRLMCLLRLYPNRPFTLPFAPGEL